MLIIPAIDLKGGKCVRLRQGKMEEALIYYEDPLKCAQHWQQLGARRLHLVDLDGALEGRAVNLSIIKKIRASHPQLEMQVGGGIRDFKAASRYLEDLGMDFIILSTYAAENPTGAKKIIDAYPGSVFLGLDIGDDKVRTAGWVKNSPVDYRTVLRRFSASPIAGIVLTDTERDGMLSGVRTDKIVELASLSSLPLIAAGGVKDITDIHKLKEQGIVSGVICGKSLYERTLDFPKAVEIANAR